MTYDPRFIALWDRCWRKSGKRAAYKAWLKLDSDEQDEVEQAFDAHRAALAQSELRFRPHLSTWLNQGRWEDELEDPLAGVQDYDPAMDPGGWEYERRMKLREGR